MKRKKKVRCPYYTIRGYCRLEDPYEECDDASVYYVEENKKESKEKTK